MDLMAFLRQLDDRDMGISGTYKKYSITYHLRLMKERNAIFLKWRPDLKQRAGLGSNPRLTLLKDEVRTIEELHGAAIRRIEEGIARENDWLEEAKSIASSPPPKDDLAWIEFL